MSRVRVIGSVLLSAALLPAVGGASPGQDNEGEGGLTAG